LDSAWTLLAGRLKRQGTLPLQVEKKNEHRAG